MRGRASRRTRWRAAVLRCRGEGMTGEIRALLLVLVDHMDKEAVVSVSRSTLAAAFDVTPSRITARLAAAIKLGLLEEVVVGGPGIQAVYQGLIPGIQLPKSHRGAVKMRSAPADQVDGPPGRTKLRSAPADQNMVRPTEPSGLWSARADQADPPEQGPETPGLYTARAPAHPKHPLTKNGSPRGRLSVNAALPESDQSQVIIPNPIRPTGDVPPEARTNRDYETERRRQLAALEQLINQDRGFEGDPSQEDA